MRDAWIERIMIKFLKLDQKAGIDSDRLNQTTATNRYGQTLITTDGVKDAGVTNLGGYLLDLDTSYYAEEKANFNLPDSSVFTVRNPEYSDAESMCGDNCEDMVYSINNAEYENWMSTLGKIFAADVRAAE